jgi:hypothetical protein
MHCLFDAVLETAGEEILVNYINERHYSNNYKMSIISYMHVILLTFRSPTAEGSVRLRLTYRFTFRLYQTYIS